MERQYVGYQAGRVLHVHEERRRTAVEMIDRYLSGVNGSFTSARAVSGRSRRGSEMAAPEILVPNGQCDTGAG